MLRISKHQLFCLIILFEIGSTTLFALGIDAKQDAWIAILVAMLIGFVLLWLYTGLQKYFPEKNFAQIIITLLGKVIGMPLVFFMDYILFIYPPGIFVILVNYLSARSLWKRRKYLYSSFLCWLYYTFFF